MAGRVLLISVNQCEHPYPVFPLGLAHLDAALRAAGHPTEWLDLQVENPPISDVVARFQPQFVGLSLRNIDDVLIKKRQVYFDRLVTICNEIRAATVSPLILGGSGFSIFPEELLERTGADFGIHGEGESSLPELLGALAAGTDTAQIPGLVWRRNGRIVANPQRDTGSITEFGPIARPERLARYYLEQSTMLNVQTQRGCSFTCCYCTYPLIEGSVFRGRDPEAVADEFEQIQRQGARYVFIVDSVFNSSPGHVTCICEALLRRKLSLKWGAFLRPSGLTRELVALMARAGLAHIEFGSDSFCDPVLQSYGKRFVFDDIAQSSEFARLAKVDYCHFLVCGGPGETRDTLRETFENSKRLQDAVILAVAGMRVYPGTPLFDLVRRGGPIPPDATLLQPHYYISPALSEDEIFAMLEDFARQSPNWIVGDPPPTYLRLVERLRRQGVVGPLWGYFSWMQRLRSELFGPARKA